MGQGPDNIAEGRVVSHAVQYGRQSELPTAGDALRSLSKGQPTTIAILVDADGRLANDVGRGLPSNSTFPGGLATNPPARSEGWTMLDMFEHVGWVDHAYVAAPAKQHDLDAPTTATLFVVDHA